LGIPQDLWANIRWAGDTGTISPAFRETHYYIKKPLSGQTLAPALRAVTGY